MGIMLGCHQYGKAETRLVRICRNGSGHRLHDLSVSTSLSGNFADAHLRGDLANLLPTDSQKNAAFAFASEYTEGAVENYALALARHFADHIEPVTAARVDVDEYLWERAKAGGVPCEHAFVRAGCETRTASAVVEGSGSGQRIWVVSGLRGLDLIKSSGSEFSGFLTDRYTTLAPTHDRLLATSVTARWRYQHHDADWDAIYASVRQLLIERFSLLQSLALQHSLWQMGRAVLDAHPEIAEIRLSAANMHQLLVDLSPFGLENPGEVFHPDDRPYGLIQCAVQRDDAPAAGSAWDSRAAFA